LKSSEAEVNRVRQVMLAGFDAADAEPPP